MSNNNINKVIMKSENYPYNMNSWCIEKSRNVLKSLTSIVEMFNNNEISFKDEDHRDFMVSFLVNGLKDATKIYGFCCGAILDEDYGSLILQNGGDGLEQVMVKFGQLKETTKQKEFRELKSLIENLNNLLTDENFNRTLIHDVIRNYKNNVKNVEKDIQAIENLIEKVTMGEMKKDEFIEIAKLTLKKIQETYKLKK